MNLLLFIHITFPIICECIHGVSYVFHHVFIENHRFVITVHYVCVNKKTFLRRKDLHINMMCLIQKFAIPMIKEI